MLYIYPSCLWFCLPVRTSWFGCSHKNLLLKSLFLPMGNLREEKSRLVDSSMLHHQSSETEEAELKLTESYYHYPLVLQQQTEYLNFTFQPLPLLYQEHHLCFSCYFWKQSSLAVKAQCQVLQHDPLFSSMVKISQVPWYEQFPVS